MEKFVLEIELGDNMRSPDDLAWALHRVASKLQGGTATGKIRDLTGDFAGKFGIEKTPDTEHIAGRLEYLRGEIKAERISYSEIAELQSLAAYIEPGDVELLEWAGVPEQGGQS
jgi:hypothetical protein